jgi:hypothetical protein
MTIEGSTPSSDNEAEEMPAEETEMDEPVSESSSQNEQGGNTYSERT